MIRLALALAALFLAACGPNIATGPHVTQAENDPPTVETPQPKPPQPKPPLPKQPNGLPWVPNPGPFVFPKPAREASK